MTHAGVGVQHPNFVSLTIPLALNKDEMLRSNSSVPSLQVSLSPPASAPASAPWRGRRGGVR